MLKTPSKQVEVLKYKIPVQLFNMLVLLIKIGTILLKKYHTVKFSWEFLYKNNSHLKWATTLNILKQLKWVEM